MRFPLWILLLGLPSLPAHAGEPASIEARLVETQKALDAARARLADLEKQVAALQGEVDRTDPPDPAKVAALADAKAKAQAAFEETLLLEERIRRKNPDWKWPKRTTGGREVGAAGTGTAAEVGAAPGAPAASGGPTPGERPAPGSAAANTPPGGAPAAHAGRALPTLPPKSVSTFDAVVIQEDAEARESGQKAVEDKVRDALRAYVAAKNSDVWQQAEMLKGVYDAYKDAEEWFEAYKIFVEEMRKKRLPQAEWVALSKIQAEMQKELTAMRNAYLKEHTALGQELTRLEAERKANK